MTNELTQLTTNELREKIKSKMEVAKFFAGFITVFLGIAFKDLSILAGDQNEVISLAAQGSMLMILAALAFSITTVFAYDRLLMPQKFWVNPVYSDDLLRHLMVSAWKRFFVPAVGTFFAALLGCLIAVTRLVVPSVVLWFIPVTIALLIYLCYSKKIEFQD
jgi:hypothetical protein